MPVKKWNIKGAGTPVEHIIKLPNVPIQLNGVRLGVPSAHLNGTPNRLDKRLLNPPPSRSNASSPSNNGQQPFLEAERHNHHHRSTSLNRDHSNVHKNSHIRAPSAAPRLGGRSPNDFRREPSPSTASEVACDTNSNKGRPKRGPNEGTANIFPSKGEAPTDNKSCTINLQPGHYKVNIEWRSASKPFLITFTPSKDKGEGRGNPPLDPEPLLYGETPPPSPPAVSLPRRIVQKMIGSPNSRGNSSGLQELQVPGFGSQEQRQGKQRKGKHRWASLSCVHMSNLDDSLGETSGCDSFAGYEGVEHLKRGSVGVTVPENETGGGFKGGRESSCSLGGCSLHSNTEFRGGFNFVDKAHLPLYTVSCDAIVNPHGASCHGDEARANDRRTWHEDEAFLRQVVDEYFSETLEDVRVPEPVSVPSNLALNNKNPYRIKMGIVKSTSDCFLSHGKSPMANIIPLQASSKMSSSCMGLITKTRSLLETVSEGNRPIGKSEQPTDEHASFEDTTVGEDDESRSGSEDSSGYEADTEPGSDKEAYGGIWFWREWMSAPDVSKASSSAGQQRFVDQGGRGSPITSSAFTPPSGGAFNYGPRKSSSSGDAHKLSQSFVCVQKFRAHKLKRFLDDANGERRDGGCGNGNKIDENDVYEDCLLSAANDPIGVLYSPRINLQFTNTKFARQNHLDVLSDTIGSGKKSDLSFDDLEFTQKALSEGLVITQSAKGESQSSRKSLSKFESDKMDPCLSEMKCAHSSSQGEVSERHSVRSKSCDSIGEKRTIKSDHHHHHQPIYYNVRSFYAKNRNIKNVSKRRRGETKRLNGDIWQPEEIPSSDCISTEIFGSSLQHSHGSGEDIMACSPSLERNGSLSYRRAPSDVPRPVISSASATAGQRVQEDRGTELQWSGATPKETMLRSELHVLPPAVSYESVNKKQQSMPLSAGKSDSPLQRVSLPTQRPNKVSNYIMGNVQPSIKESGSSSLGTEDSDSADKFAKKKSATKLKTRKSFNTFLGSFGAAGALAKNSPKESSSVVSETKKPNLFFATSSSNGEKRKDNCNAADKQRGPSSALLLSGSQCLRPTNNSASANRSPVSRKAIKKECNRNETEEKSVSSGSDDSVSGGSATCNKSGARAAGGGDAQFGNEEAATQPIYENVLFHRQRYVGKFSYINSLIQTSETEDKPPTSVPPSNVEKAPPASHPTVSTNFSSSNFESTFEPPVISHASRPLLATEEPPSYPCHRSPSGDNKVLEKGEQPPPIPRIPLLDDPPNLYEDFVSARGSPPRNLPSNTFADDDDEGDEEEEASDEATEGADDSDGGLSVTKVSMSSESVASDASSFYYTAGGSALYDAIESVTEYFSIADKKEFPPEAAGTDALKKDIVLSPSDCGKETTGGSRSNRPISLPVERLEKNQPKKAPDEGNKPAEKEAKPNHHDYVNARVVVTDDDKVLIDLRPTPEEGAAAYADGLSRNKTAAEGANRDSPKLSRNETNSGNKNFLLENKLKVNFDENSKLENANHDERKNDPINKEENKNKFHAKLGLENESVPFEDISYSGTVPSMNNRYDEEGIVYASPCVAVSSDEEATRTYVNDAGEKYPQSPSLHTNFDSEGGAGEAGAADLEQEDLLESYYSQLAREKKRLSPLSGGRQGAKLEEEEDLLTTEPEVSSLYAQTTFSESICDTSSLGNSESHRNMGEGEYRSSPFSSSEGISEISGGSEHSLDHQSFSRSNNNNNDSGSSSLSCDGNCDQPPRKNIFRVPLSGPAFPHRRHTFQFVPSSSSEHNSHGFYAQRRSNPDLPPGLGPPWNLSPTSPVDAKKPPRSPSHRGRDSSSVPREGRSGIQMRRRCRSVSSGSSVDTSKEGGDLSHSQQPRPSSLISISRGQATSSQESLHDLPSFRFSPAAGDKAPNIRWLAERKKHEGNECYKAKEYRNALKLYTEAVELCPECAPYYSNRSACYMMLGKYAQALSDAREAVRLDTTFVKGYLRIAKCNIALGDANAALAVLRQASELDPGNKSIREEESNAQALMKCCEDADKAAFRKDYRMAIFHIDRALTLAAGCRSLKITKAEYLIYLHRYGDAQEIVNEILQFDSGNADAIYVRGMCLYYQNNHEAAFTHFQHVLRLAPDHKKAKDVYKKAKLLRQKKDEGNQAFNRGNLQGALTTYTEALAVDPNNVSTNSKLYCNRATVRAKLRNFDEAVDDCTAAINLDEGYVKAYLRRAKCYQELEKHEEAVRDYEKVCKLDRNQENKRLLQEAKTLLKRSKWKDYYKILGVTKTASEDEIKKSYKKMALQHHPDRHASASEKEKHEHEVKFKEIGEAYTILTDTKKKAMYDRGQDVNESDCGMFHDEVDPNQIFQAFFGQGGNNAFSFGGNGGFPGAGFSGGNFPGGFHFQFS